MVASVNISECCGSNTIPHRTSVTICLCLPLISCGTVSKLPTARTVHVLLLRCESILVLVRGLYRNHFRCVETVVILYHFLRRCSRRHVLQENFSELQFLSAVNDTVSFPNIPLILSRKCFQISVITATRNPIILFVSRSVF